MVIFSGDGVVTTRCDYYGSYFNPREMAGASPGGRYNAYFGNVREVRGGRRYLPIGTL